MHKLPQDYPRAEKKPQKLEMHGDVRTDDYFWMNNRENPQVIAHLNAENSYTQSVLSKAGDLEGEIFNELKSRIKEDESFAPVKDGEFYYSAKYEVGQQYPIYFRRKGSLTAPEEILLNVPELAKGHSFYQTSPPKMSPNHQIMAYAVDTVGRRFFTVYFKDLKSGKLLPNKIENITGNLVWAQDNETVFYAQQNPQTLRSEKIFRYNLKTQKTDLVYFEEDDTFSVYVYQPISEKFIYLGSSSTLTTEVRYLPADKPQENFKLFAPRERGHEYSVEDNGQKFYILTNHQANNFKVMSAEFTQTDRKGWKEVIPHRPDIYLQGMTLFKNHLVLDQRKNGLTQIEITNYLGQNSYYVPFQDESYVASTGDNRELDSETLRFNYQSLRRPASIYDFNFTTKAQTLVKTQEVPNYNPELYKAERIFIKARDGAQVPVSLLMKKDHKADGKAPMLIYGYGSYGANMEPWFDSDVFSLVDRDFVYAIAHIRGGSEMGREWYDNGRTMHKMNSFYDFIDCTEGLIQNKLADPKKVFAMGGSAGGLLMGAIVNLRPDLYRGIVSQVAFVDVITTMLDSSIPLTTSEYDQWGNPNEKAAYDYIKSYSPYDNIKRQAYPNILATTGLHDSQVQYWEPAKWVAKLREYNTADSVILLKTDMEAGHGGSSGRFDKLKDTATEYAFILLINK